MLENCGKEIYFSNSISKFFLNLWIPNNKDFTPSSIRFAILLYIKSFDNKIFSNS